MKKMMLFILVVVLSFPVLAQESNDFFKQLTNKYAEKDGFSASMITKDMFDLYLKKKNVDSESTVFGAIKNLDKILVVSQSNMSGAIVGTWSAAKDLQSEKPEKAEKTPNELYESILNHYNGDAYTLLKTEKRMGEEVKVYLKKNQDKVVSLALITNSEVSTNLVELQGDINLMAVAELNKAMNLRGLENLYKINNSGNVAYFGYSNGSGTEYSQQKIEEMVARQREMAERQRFLSDEQRAKIEEMAQFQAQKQMEMAEKYREMAEKYQREPIFLNYPGDSTVYYLNGKKVDMEEIKKLDRGSIKTIDISGPEKKNDKTAIRIRTK